MHAKSIFAVKKWEEKPYEKISQERRIKNIKGLLFALMFCAFAVSSLAQTSSWSRGIQILPISCEECKSRALNALKAEGYIIENEGGENNYDYYYAAYKSIHSAVITCDSWVDGKTWANIFVASCIDNRDGNIPGAERVRLQERMNQSSPGEQFNSIVGTWTWAFAQSGEPQENGKITFSADGTMMWNGDNSKGKWEQNGRSITLRWDKGSVDILTLSNDGRTLDGTNKDGWRVKGTRN